MRSFDRRPHTDDMNEMLDRIDAVEETQNTKFRLFWAWYDDFLRSLVPIDIDGPFLDEVQ